MKFSWAGLKPRLREWVHELLQHPLTALLGCLAGVAYALGALMLDRIALRRESALFQPSPLVNLPLFLGSLLAAAAALWIMVQFAVRQQLGVVFVAGISLGAIAGFLIYAIAGALAG